MRWPRTEEDSHPTEVIRPSNCRPFPDGRGNYDHGRTAARDIEFICKGMPTGVSLSVWLPQKREKYLEAQRQQPEAIGQPSVSPESQRGRSQPRRRRNCRTDRLAQTLTEALRIGAVATRHRIFVWHDPNSGSQAYINRSTRFVRGRSYSLWNFAFNASTRVWKSSLRSCFFCSRIAFRAALSASRAASS